MLYHGKPIQYYTHLFAVLQICLPQVRYGYGQNNNLSLFQLRHLSASCVLVLIYGYGHDYVMFPHVGSGQWQMKSCFHKKRRCHPVLRRYIVPLFQVYIDAQRLCAFHNRYYMPNRFLLFRKLLLQNVNQLQLLSILQKRISLLQRHGYRLSLPRASYYRIGREEGNVLFYLARQLFLPPLLAGERENFSEYLLVQPTLSHWVGAPSR